MTDEEEVRWILRIRVQKEMQAQQVKINRTTGEHSEAEFGLDLRTIDYEYKY